MAEKCALARKDVFYCTLSFFGSTAFECEQTVRNKSKKCPKSTFSATYWAARRRAKPAAMKQDFCQHPRDVADMWLDYCS